MADTRVLVDLAQADPLAVGMKVDVYFQPDGLACYLGIMLSRTLPAG
jgi:hypothetical protein